MKISLIRKKTVFLFTFIITIVFCLFGKIATVEVSAFSGTGEGTLTNPYEITTKTQLSEVRNNLSAYYKLLNNIDLENTEWTPIGTRATPFTGNFDGNNFIISNVLINMSTLPDIGFFGSTSNAIIKNINLKDINVTSTQKLSIPNTGGLIGSALGNSLIQNCSVSGGSKVSALMNLGGLLGNIQGGTVELCSSSATVTAPQGDNVGGLIGTSAANITKSYSNAEVTSGGYCVGGLIGRIQSKNISIMECYSAGVVTGGNSVGGLIGCGTPYSWTVSNCFALGSVTVTMPDGADGGLIGQYATNVSNCYAAVKMNNSGLNTGGLFGSINTSINNITKNYYDGITAGLVPQSIYNSGKLTSAMKAQETYIGWNFGNVWVIDEGTSYPYLINLPKPLKVNSGLPINDVSAGIGTASRPYLITTKEQLNNIRYDMTGYYKLEANIDLENISWEPAGKRSAPFSGNFDGNNYTISNLLIDKSILPDIGFFGNTNNATIKNVNLSNSSVTSTQKLDIPKTGGLIGSALGNSIIQNCSIDGESRVAALGNVGGLIGNTQGGTVELCSSSAYVTASKGDYVGGLIGANAANVKKSCADGEVISSGNCVGGLIGNIQAKNVSITECYSAGNVTGSSNVGGLIGNGIPYNWTVSNSFAIGSVTVTTPNAHAGGLIGGYTSNVINCYAAVKLIFSGNNTGGLHSFTNSVNNISNSYFDISITGISTPTTQTRTTTKLMQQATYSGWDFTNVWSINEGTSYAYLRNLPNPQAPTAPGNLRVLSTSMSAITLSWDFSTDNDGVAGYKIYRDGEEVSNTTSNEYIDTGLSPDTSYKYFVIAYDVYGINSMPSNEVIATTEYDPPLKLTLDLPERIRVNSTLNISTNPVGIDTLPVIWLLEKDNVKVDFNRCATANLNTTGGNIIFNEVGNYTLIAQITDLKGRIFNYSDTIMVYGNNPPSAPVIMMNPNTNCVAPGTSVTINAFSTDLDGDEVTYIWEGRPAEQFIYPIGKNTIKVKAVDSLGAESPWTAIVFFVADSTNGGGLVLSGPESTIIEHGIAGGTITEYTFTVPPVDGHSGSDYGKISGYNQITGQWEQITLQNTENGVSMTGTLPVGTYTMLEFYYYTSHDCMYNKSNITYSVKYSFE